METIDYKVATLEMMANEKNPRWMPDRMMESLQESLTAFGAVEPVIVNKQTNRIVGGHQRVKAAIALGLKTLPVVLVDLDPTKEIALNIFLNKVRGDWDYGKLAEVLKGIDSSELSVTGFTEIEVNSICAAFNDNDMDAILNGDSDPGVEREVRNRTAGEVREMAEAFSRVQFGMFNKNVTIGVYETWVQTLVSKSKNGTSPIALGLVVASMLGLDVVEDASGATDEETPEYNFDELGDESTDEE